MDVAGACRSKNLDYIKPPVKVMSPPSTGNLSGREEGRRTTLGQVGRRWSCVSLPCAMRRWEKQEKNSFTFMVVSAITIILDSLIAIPTPRLYSRIHAACPTSTRMQLDLTFDMGTLGNTKHHPSHLSAGPEFHPRGTVWVRRSRRKFWPPRNNKGSRKGFMMVRPRCPPDARSCFPL